MREETYGAVHVLIVEDDETEVLHPTGCPRHEVMEGVKIHWCDIGAHLYEWGYDLYFDGIEHQPGMYLIQYWSIPQGWAGPVALDAEAGIEIRELVIKE